MIQQNVPGSQQRNPDSAAAGNDHIVGILNNLIETLKDGQDGFRSAAEGIKSSELKTLFGTYAQQRAQLATELQSEVRRLGGDPEKTGTVAGAIHRGWIDLKAAVTGKDETAIIDECERGEDSAVKNYREALMKEDLPSEVRILIDRQFVTVKQTHDRIRDMKRAHHVKA